MTTQDLAVAVFMSFYRDAKPHIAEVDRTSSPVTNPRFPRARKPTQEIRMKSTPTRPGAINTANGPCFPMLHAHKPPLIGDETTVPPYPPKLGPKTEIRTLARPIGDHRRQA